MSPQARAALDRLYAARRTHCDHLTCNGGPCVLGDNPTPAQRRTEAALRGWANRSPEDLERVRERLAAAARTRAANESPEFRRERARRGGLARAAALAPEERRAISASGGRAQRSPEARARISEGARARMLSLTPEERRERARRGALRRNAKSEAA